MKKMGFLAYVDCSAKTGNGIKEVHTVCVDYKLHNGPVNKYVNTTKFYYFPFSKSNQLS